MKKTIFMPSVAILAMCLAMTSCSQAVTEEVVPASLPEESVTETTVEPFEPILITEDYDGPILGFENWHIEYEDLSWGSIAAINAYLIDDDTGKKFAAYGGLQDELCAYLADLNGDGEPELVCNGAWGTETDFRNHTCIYRLNDGIIEIALRVQLFSNPQHIHARMANKEYLEKESEDMSVSDKRILANVIRIIPAQSLPEILSLKITNAITDVATISKLFRRDTVSADELLIEIISRIGAMISKMTIAIR